MEDDYLTIWVLTLPSVDGAGPESDLDRVYLNPDTWPGDWKHFQHGSVIGVRAASEENARECAAEHDCAIWKDPLYARCRRIEEMDPAGPGVLFMVRSGADNE